MAMTDAEAWTTEDEEAFQAEGRARWRSREAEAGTTIDKFWDKDDDDADAGLMDGEAKADEEPITQAEEQEKTEEVVDDEVVVVAVTTPEDKKPAAFVNPYANIRKRGYAHLPKNIMVVDPEKKKKKRKNN